MADTKGSQIPFKVKRIFYMYDTSEDVVRGCHANRRTQFVLINVVGSCTVKVKDGKGNQAVYLLNKPNMGLYLPAMVWKDMYNFSKTSVLLVLASDYFDSKEYIRDYAEFEEKVRDLNE